jgi:lysophospholipase L1-like esterase
MSRKVINKLLYISLTLNFILGSILTYYFSKRFFYHKIVHARMLSAFNPEPTSCILFMGDSQVEGFKLSVHFVDMCLINWGISGLQTPDLSKHIDRIGDLQPAKVFILSGINDLRYGREEKAIVMDLEKVIKDIRTESPQTKIYILSVLPLNEQSGLRLQASNEKVRNVNNLLKNRAEELMVEYINLFSILSEEGQLSSTYTYDGLHLNNRGYDAIAMKMAPFITEK